MAIQDFARACQAGYAENPYHNFAHAFMTTHLVSLFLHELRRLNFQDFPLIFNEKSWIFKISQ